MSPRPATAAPGSGTSRVHTLLFEDTEANGDLAYLTGVVLR